MLPPSGNPIKSHDEEVFYLQPMIPPKRFDIFPPLTRGCSEGLDAFRFFFTQRASVPGSLLYMHICVTTVVPVHIMYYECSSTYMYILVPSPPETWFRGMSVGGSFRQV